MVHNVCDDCKAILYSDEDGIISHKHKPWCPHAPKTRWDLAKGDTVNHKTEDFTSVITYVGKKSPEFVMLRREDLPAHMTVNVFHQRELDKENE